jgi:Fanconi-associated nuclease 1
MKMARSLAASPSCGYIHCNTHELSARLATRECAGAQTHVKLWLPQGGLVVEAPLARRRLRARDSGHGQQREREPRQPHLERVPSGGERVPARNMFAFAAPPPGAAKRPLAGGLSLATRSEAAKRACLGVRGDAGAASLDAIEFDSAVVGCRFHGGALERDENGRAAPLQRLEVSRDSGNERDPRALLVRNARGESLGHLPAAVAAVLAPLVDARLVALSLRLHDASAAESKPLRIAVRVFVTPLQRDALALRELPFRLSALASSPSPGDAHGGAYLGNLEAAVASAMARAPHLFDEAERDELARFGALPLGARQLFARLVTRRGAASRWFALARLRGFVEIGDAAAVAAAAAALAAAGAAELASADSLPQGAAFRCLAAALPRAMLRELAAAALGKAAAASMMRGASAASCKAALARTLASQRDLAGRPLLASPALRAHWARMCGTWTRLSPSLHHVATRAQLVCTLVGGEEGWALLHARDVRRAVFAPYRLPSAADAHVFASRAALLEFEAALALAARFEDAFPEAVARVEGARGGGGGGAQGGDDEEEEGAEEEEEEAEGGGGGQAATEFACGEAADDEVVVLSDGDCVADDAAAPFARALAIARRARAWLERLRGRPAGEGFAARFRAEWVLARVCGFGAAVLERQRRYGEAVAWLRWLLSLPFAAERRGAWHARLALDLERHLQRPHEALAAAVAALADAATRTGERAELERRAQRLWQRLRVGPQPVAAAAAAERERLWTRVVRRRAIRGRPTNRAAGERSRFFGYDNEMCSVEHLALQFYAQRRGGGWRGEHCENGLLHTLFGLLLWAPLFAPVPHVFQTPFQAAPLDLDTDCFFSARAPLIEAALARIAVAASPHEMLALLRPAWRHRPAACRGVAWTRWPLAELVRFCTCVGGRVLAGMCESLARDHAAWSGGLPDLFLWRWRRRGGEGEGEEEEEGEDEEGDDEEEDDKEDEEEEVEEQQQLGGDSWQLASQEDGEESAAAAPASLEEEEARVQALLAEWDSGSVEYAAAFCEVKGPRDRLSAQQRAWIERLAALSEAQRAPRVFVELLRVRERAGAGVAE